MNVLSDTYAWNHWTTNHTQESSSDGPLQNKSDNSDPHPIKDLYSSLLYKSLIQYDLIFIFFLVEISSNGPENVYIVLPDIIENNPYELTPNFI